MSRFTIFGPTSDKWLVLDTVTQEVAELPTLYEIGEWCEQQEQKDGLPGASGPPSSGGQPVNARQPEVGGESPEASEG